MDSNELRIKVIKKLNAQGYVVDSAFEGDFRTWVGVYARPRNRPTYNDPLNEEEAEMQDRFREYGMLRDFAEWFEWKIVGEDLVE